MENSIEKEIVRLVKEIAEDESDLGRAQRFENEDKSKRLLSSIDRKMELLRILKSKA